MTTKITKLYVLGLIMLALADSGLGWGRIQGRHREKRRTKQRQAKPTCSMDCNHGSKFCCKVTEETCGSSENCKECHCKCAGDEDNCRKGHRCGNAQQLNCTAYSGGFECKCVIAPLQVLSRPGTS
uniref:Uncharacterized protein n=1 Tax=Rhipicephalus pulchellus TaxID=72859 RepID=L7LV78_RHIPC